MLVGPWSLCAAVILFSYLIVSLNKLEYVEFILSHCKIWKYRRYIFVLNILSDRKFINSVIVNPENF